MLPEPELTFQNQVRGIWGCFDAPAGTVSYILTNARLGGAEIDPERRLTSQLRPVREVLPAQRLNFNQLLQRDLDDHRVATQLVPYLLLQREDGPAFFPPIMAVLLPFRGNEPLETFAEPPKSSIITEHGSHWMQERVGEAFRLRRLAANASGDLHQIKYGELAWNDERSKLVVLDGQHRAMALIAIDRTITKTWSNSGGERYRHFYESRIAELMHESGSTLPREQVDRIQIPVCVCWFPAGSAGYAAPHAAARKLFVDVNKEARKPSEARLILLSDAKLVNVFTRSLLNHLRDDQAPVPLSAIEYDNPDEQANSAARWSALASLSLLNRAVELTVFCPTKYLTNMSQKFGARLPETEMDQRMRQELNVAALFPEIIDDGEVRVERERLGNTVFPRSTAEVLSKEFMAGWGAAILRVLSELLPYRAHVTALEEIERDWLADDSMSSLARDAIFEGVGMYWTLRSSHEYWLERQRDSGTKMPKSDIVKAWDIIGKKEAEFFTRRARHFMGKESPEAVRAANAAYAQYNTLACQLGAIMAVGAVAHALKRRGPAVAETAGHLVKAWNDALSASLNQSRTRRLVFSRDEQTTKHRLNRLPRLKPTLAVYFRYLWLELLCTPEGSQALESATLARIVDLRNEARRGYLDFLVAEEAKRLKGSGKGRNDADRYDSAEKHEVAALGKALAYWMQVGNEEYEAWRTAAQSSPPEVPDDADGAESPEDADAPDEERTQSLDDVISEATED